MVLDDFSFNPTSAQAVPLPPSPHSPLGVSNHGQYGAEAAAPACRAAAPPVPSGGTSLLHAPIETQQARTSKCLYDGRDRLISIFFFLNEPSLSCLPAVPTYPTLLSFLSHPTYSLCFGKKG